MAVGQQRQRVGHIAAHRHHDRVGDIGLVDDLIHAHHAGQKMGEALAVAAAILIFQAVVTVDHAAAQVRVHQRHLDAALCQRAHQVHGQIALALCSMAAGDHDLFDTRTCKGEVGAQGIKGFISRIIQSRKFCDLQLFHAFLPELPPTRRRTSLANRLVRRLNSLFSFGCSPASASGIDASTTMPAYLRISSADL